MSLSDFTKRDRGGRDVVQSKVEVRGVGGGLNPALEVAPIQLFTGQKIRVVMELEVDYLGFPRVKGTDMLCRNHVLRLVEGRIAVAETDSDFDRECLGYLNGSQELVARLFHEADFEETQEGEPVQQAITDVDDGDLDPLDDEDDREWEASAEKVHA